MGSRKTALGEKLVGGVEHAMEIDGRAENRASSCVYWVYTLITVYCLEGVF